MPGHFQGVPHGVDVARLLVQHQDHLAVHLLCCHQGVERFYHDLRAVGRGGGVMVMVVVVVVGEGCDDDDDFDQL